MSYKLGRSDQTLPDIGWRVNKLNLRSIWTNLGKLCPKISILNHDTSLITNLREKNMFFLNHQPLRLISTSLTSQRAPRWGAHRPRLPRSPGGNRLAGSSVTSHSPAPQGWSKITMFLSKKPWMISRYPCIDNENYMYILHIITYIYIYYYILIYHDISLCIIIYNYIYHVGTFVETSHLLGNFDLSCPRHRTGWDGDALHLFKFGRRLP